jgi:hypothetical protein
MCLHSAHVSSPPTPLLVYQTDIAVMLFGDINPATRFNFILLIIVDVACKQHLVSINERCRKSV